MWAFAHALGCAAVGGLIGLLRTRIDRGEPDGEVEISACESDGDCAVAEGCSRRF